MTAKAPGIAVSVADEVHTIVSAGEGALLLLDGGQLPRSIEADPTKAATAIVAILVSRLHQIECALRQSIDPAVLLAAHNSTTAVARAGEDPDVRLVPRAHVIQRR